MESITREELEEATEGRYEVQSLIGMGGMGAVYLAIDRTLGSRVAIKTLPPEVRTSTARLARFRREAALSAQLATHPNVVRVLDFKVKEDIAYLVMPYIDGVSLEQHLREHGPLTYGELRKLLEDVGTALTYAHVRGVVHRDVKPANILLEKDTRRWLLTDFGIAHVTSFDDTDITHTEATMGTLTYMAPEQFGNAKHVDGRADLYSLAAVAFECLTGEVPEREGPIRVSRQLHRKQHSIPENLARAIASPLAEVREERPASVADWLQLLDKATRKKRIGLSAGIAAGVVAATLTVIGVRGCPSQPSETIPLVAVFPLSASVGAEGPSELDSLLSQTFTSQVIALPGFRALEEALVRAAVNARFGSEPQQVEALLAVTRDIEATQALVPRVTVRGDSMELSVQLWDAEDDAMVRGASRTGPRDSLPVLIPALIQDVFGELIADAQPATLEGLIAYVNGDRALRTGAFDEAIRLFEEVIDSDSTFAPAYLKRALAMFFKSRPTQAAREVGAALEAAETFAHRLDPISQALLGGYIELFREGDIAGAQAIFESVRNSNPESADAWFLLGMIQLKLPLGGGHVAEARRSFAGAVRRDPNFALAYVMLFQIELFQGQQSQARTYLDNVLDLVQTSWLSELLQVSDTLVYGSVGQRASLLLRFPGLRDEILENVATEGVGNLNPPGGHRPLAINAINELLRRVEDATAREYTRMRLAAFVGSGQLDSARAFLANPRRNRIPSVERDMWLVLGGATVLGDMSDDAQDVAEAASRLLRADENRFVANWLVARYARHTGNASLADSADANLLSISPDAVGILERSLQLDLQAQDALAAGNDSTALALWEQAIEYYDIEKIFFGLVESLWPVRADYALTALEMGEYGRARELARGFHRMAGFVDQVAWEPVLRTDAAAALAMDDPAGADSAYTWLVDAWREASGEAVDIRDALNAARDSVRSGQLRSQPAGRTDGGQ